MSTGALTPAKAVQNVLDDGIHHLHEPLQLAFLKNVAGGLIVGLSGVFSMTVAGGCPGLQNSNPGIVHLLQGATFSTSLVFVYMTGAELFTGYPMWFMITALEREGKVLMYIRAVINSLLGNLAGALTASALFSYASGALTEAPYRSYVVSEIQDNIVEAPWHVIFIRAIACGHLVTLAMLLGSQQLDGISKALGLWLPFILATSLHFPHTVEYMHLASTAMILGSSLSVGEFLWKCMLPIILGNTVGGAVFTGLFNWWVYLACEDGKEQGPTLASYAHLNGNDDD